MILIYKHELTTDFMTTQTNNFMERVVAKIGNSKQPLFDGTNPYRLYYSPFVVTNDADNNVLP